MDDTELTAGDLSFHARMLEDGSFRIVGKGKDLDQDTRRDLIATCSHSISGISHLLADLVELEQEEAEAAQESA